MAALSGDQRVCRLFTSDPADPELPNRLHTADSLLVYRQFTSYVVVTVVMTRRKLLLLPQHWLKNLIDLSDQLPRCSCGSPNSITSGWSPPPVSRCGCQCCVADGSDRRRGRRGDAAVRGPAAAPHPAAGMDLHQHFGATRTPVRLSYRPHTLAGKQPGPTGQPLVLCRHIFFNLFLLLHQLCEWDLSGRGTAQNHLQSGGEGWGGWKGRGTGRRAEEQRQRGWRRRRRRRWRRVFVFSAEHGGQTEVPQRHRKNSSGHAAGHHWIHQKVCCIYTDNRDAAVQLSHSSVCIMVLRPQ